MLDGRAPTHRSFRWPAELRPLRDDDAGPIARTRAATCHPHPYQHRRRLLPRSGPSAMTSAGGAVVRLRSVDTKTRRIICRKRGRSPRGAARGRRVNVWQRRHLGAARMEDEMGRSHPGPALAAFQPARSPRGRARSGMLRRTHPGLSAGVQPITFSLFDEPAVVDLAPGPSGVTTTTAAPSPRRGGVIDLLRSPDEGRAANLDRDEQHGLAEPNGDPPRAPGRPRPRIRAPRWAAWPSSSAAQPLKR
jgi:hypothetical protein